MVLKSYLPFQQIIFYGSEENKAFSLRAVKRQKCVLQDISPFLPRI